MKSKTILIQSEGLGRGDDTLGGMLMANFLRLLGESENKPSNIILWNAGARLACHGSKVIEHLKRLEQQGIEISVCTTCLEYFDLMDQLLVGKPTTMIKSIVSILEHDIVTL
jgi:selenium metabolism protein YedF